MTQCAAPQAVHNESENRVAEREGGGVVATPQGSVTTQRLGDTTIMTRTLIHHALTNKDSGKVYQEVTVVSPRGTSVQERVIVQAQPRLVLKNVTKR